jgi:hypothetical protein
MLNQVSSTPETTISQDGTVTLLCDPNSTSHAFTIKAGTATAGTIAVTFTPVGLSSTEVLYDQYGTAVTQNLATTTQKTYSTNGAAPIKSITFTMSGGNGTATVVKSDM